MAILIDLDANATTAVLPEVIESVARCLRDSPGNPGSRHALGRKARQVLETSRESIAAILGADPEEVIFTSGGTERITWRFPVWRAGRPGRFCCRPANIRRISKPAGRWRTAAGV